MLSTLLELAGFAALIAATYLIGGLIAGLYLAGGLLLVVGYAVDDERAVMALRRAVRPVRLRVALVRANVARRRLAKAG